jgi:hypothetical protein
MARCAAITCCRSRATTNSTAHSALHCTATQVTTAGIAALLASAPQHSMRSWEQPLLGEQQLAARPLTNQSSWADKSPEQQQAHMGMMGLARDASWADKSPEQQQPRMGKMREASKASWGSLGPQEQHAHVSKAGQAGGVARGMARRKITR